ncbi:flippase [Ravibacter arvi]|uniref:Flippase n=1 Tax=Ravibacter arvi TaxID=2051041 RepID=A0ABP8LWX6_9BACT
MGIIVRQSLKASLGFYIGALVGIINQMFISTHFLSVEQLAISRLLVENAILFATFSHLGAPFIADKFFGQFRNDEEQHHGLLFFLLGLPLIGGGLFTLLYWAFTPAIKSYFSSQSPLLVQYHYLVIPFTFLWIYLLVLESYTRNHSRIAIPSFIREVYLRVANVLLVLMFGFGWFSFDVLLYLVIGAYALAVGILIFYIARLGRLYIRWPDRRMFNGKQVRTMLGYGSYTLIGGLGVSIILTLDRSMLAGEKGLVSAGIFIIASYIASIIEIPKKAISQISIPFLSDALRSERREDIQSLTRKSALHQLLVGGFFFLLLWVNIDDIFKLLPKGETYGDGKLVVLLIGLVKLFDIGTGLNTEIILYSRHFRWSTILTITAAVVSLFLNFWLIPSYGFTGAAIAAALSTLGLSGFKLAFVWQHYKISPFTRRTFLTIVIWVISLLLNFLLPEFPAGNYWTILLSILLRSITVGGTFIFLIFLCRVSPEISSITDNWLKQFPPFPRGKKRK